MGSSFESSTAARRLLWLIIGLIVLFVILRVASRFVPRPVTAGIALVLFAVVARNPTWRTRLGITTRDMGRGVLLGVLAAASLTAVLLGLAALYWGADMARHLWGEILHQPLSARLDFLAIGITAAIAEELLFRGLLQPIAIDKLGMILGILVVALAFTVSHPRVFSWPPFMFSNLFLTGLLYGVLRGRDRPLTAVLVAHTLAWVQWGGA